MNKTKNAILTLLIMSIIIMSTILTGCGNTTDGTQDETQEVVEIGVLLPLTGAGAAYGDIYRKAALEYETNINKEGTKIKLIIEDNKMDPKETVSIVQKMKAEGVEVFFVPFSGPSMALEEFAKNKEIILLANNYDSEYASKQEYIFNGANSELQYAIKLISQEIKENEKCEKITFHSVNVPLAEPSFKTLNDNLDAEIGKDIVNVGEKDYNTLIAKMKNENIKCMTMSTYDFMATNVFKQLIERNYEGLDIYLLNGKDSVNLNTMDKMIPDFEEYNINIYTADFAIDELTDSANAEKWRKDLVLEHPELKDSVFVQQVYDTLEAFTSKLDKCDEFSKQCMVDNMRDSYFEGSTNKETYVNENGDIINRRFVLFQNNGLKGFDQIKALN